MTGFYLNELLLKLLRAGSHPERSYDAYAGALAALKTDAEACARCGCSRSGCSTRSATGSRWSATATAGRSIPHRYYRFRLGRARLRIDGVAGARYLLRQHAARRRARGLRGAGVCAEARARCVRRRDRCLEGKELRTRDVMLRAPEGTGGMYGSIGHAASRSQRRPRRHAAPGARRPYPDPVFAALIAEQGGADSITMHLREDRRHIQDRDVRAIRDALQTRLNFEMAATDEMVRIASRCGRRIAASCRRSAPK